MLPLAWRWRVAHLNSSLHVSPKACLVVCARLGWGGFRPADRHAQDKKVRMGLKEQCIHVRELRMSFLSIAIASGPGHQG